MISLFKKTALTRTLFFVFTDIIFICLSAWLSFFIRFEGDIPVQYFLFLYRMIALTVIFAIPIFYFHGLYAFSWSYVSTNELVSLFKAVTIAFIFLGITIFVSKYFPMFKGFPRSVLLMEYLLVFILCGGIRISKRVYMQITGQSGANSKEKTLIVGAGDAGEQILRSMLSSKNSPYHLIGFVDDNPIKQGVSIHGYKVLGTISDIPEIIEKNKVDQLIVALPSAGNDAVKRTINLAKAVGIKKIKITPLLSEIINGRVSFNNLRDVDVVDLLNRSELVLDTTQIDNFIKNKIVLITGAAGSIGSELSRQAAKFSPSFLALLDQDETGIFNISEELKKSFPDLKIKSIIADVSDKNKIDDTIKIIKPEIIFHAAAYKHVPLMEENPDEAVKNNIFGTENLAIASINNGVKNFVFISTDKAVNPTSVMGFTKRIGEMVCRAFNKQEKTKFVSVRFGNVLDSRGSVIPTFREQIKSGGPVEVTHPDMQRYFMLIPEACLLVMQAGAIGEGGEVFVLDMGKPVKILDLAKEMIRLSGLTLDKDIAIVFTGIRPGEKLFEEILTAEEGTGVTKYHKIFTAKLKDIDEKEFFKKISALKNDLKNIRADQLSSIIK
jgi:FlaA1/EpsC-like NDP-sugar epimerase